MKILFFLLLLVTSIGSAQLKYGSWRGVLMLDSKNNIELPFNFEIKQTKGKLKLIIQNAKERIVIEEIVLKKDSLNFKMPIFDSEFKTQLIGDSVLVGSWINHARKDNNVISFMASFGNKNRFDFPPEKPTSFYAGRWEACFSPTQPDSSKAVGVFNHIPGSTIVEGTFLTETGDYRFLEGTEHGGKLYLSCFDGSHAFLFIAENNGTSITKGDFYSGNSWHENWVAKRNENFELRDPETLTYLKNPNENIAFSFYNAKGKKISLSDAKYKNKVVIIQIMGSWCPNCMDESQYLSQVYKRYKSKGLEIIALAYERTTDAERAKANIMRLTKRFDIGYDILLTGLNGKDKAAASLPFLNGVMAFPTTIFLDRTHNVKSIYTGYNGPATGLAHEKYTFKTESLINNLLYKKE